MKVYRQRVMQTALQTLLCEVYEYTSWTWGDISRMVQKVQYKPYSQDGIRGVLSHVHRGTRIMSTGASSRWYELVTKALKVHVAETETPWKVLEMIARSRYVIRNPDAHKIEYLFHKYDHKGNFEGASKVLIMGLTARQRELISRAYKRSQKRLGTVYSEFFY